MKTRSRKNRKDILRATKFSQKEAKFFKGIFPECEKKTLMRSVNSKELKEPQLIPSNAPFLPVWQHREAPKVGCTRRVVAKPCMPPVPPQNSPLTINSAFTWAGLNYLLKDTQEDNRKRYTYCVCCF